ncbi:MAG: hypothetical protein RIT45_3626 [Pseudomonadota bacterium]|jgi:penicillin-binding protein 1C
MRGSVGARAKRWRLLARATVVVVVLAVTLAGWLAAWTPALPSDVAGSLAERYLATRVVDVHGAPLGELVSAHGQRGEPVPLAAFSQRLIDATLEAEDRRFFAHPGVDLLAVVRAAQSNLRAGRVVSGASTLTQQLARMVAPAPRGWRSKVRESVWALQLEARYDKATILAWYLSVAPYGGLLRGAEVASRTLFDRPASELSWRQAALLAVLPRSPEALDLRRRPERAERLADALLDRLWRRGKLTDAERAAAARERLEVRAVRSPFEAPHVLDVMRRRGDRPVRIRTTIERELQRDLQRIVRAEAERLHTRDARNAALVVLDAQTGDVLAMVGSQGYLDREDLGANNGTLARRSPGSTLKPFAYALAFDDGGSPADVWFDVEAHFDTEHGDWRPENYARRYHGPVRARLALANSLNVPAVRVVEAIGVARLQQTLRDGGISGLDRDPMHYGLGLALGDADVALLELAGAYTAFARGGVAVRPRLVAEVQGRDGVAEPAPAGESRRLFSAQAASMVVDILADPLARTPAFGRRGGITFDLPAAVKTGTSKGNRDALAVGVTAEYVVAAWVGNFDGRATDDLTGASGAGRLLRGALDRLAERGALHLPERAAGLRKVEVCPLSGATPGASCPHSVREWVHASAPARPACTMHRAGGLHLVGAARAWAERAGLPLAAAPAASPDPHGASLTLLAPIQGGRYWVDSQLGDGHIGLSWRAATNPPGAMVQWSLDGVPLGPPEPADRARPWQPTPGHHRLEVRRLDGLGVVAAEFDVMGLRRTAER